MKSAGECAPVRAPDLRWMASLRRAMRTPRANHHPKNDGPSASYWHGATERRHPPSPSSGSRSRSSSGRGSRRMPLDPAARAGVSSRSLPSGNMKPIAPLLAVLSLAVIATGCETALKESCCGSSRCADSRPRREHRIVAEKVGAGLFWLGQSALHTAANDTAQTQVPFPY